MLDHGALLSITHTHADAYADAYHAHTYTHKQPAEPMSVARTILTDASYTSSINVPACQRCLFGLHT